MPAGAQFPEDTDLWTPLTVRDLANGTFSRDLLVFGRLADGATLAAARREVDGVARRAISGNVNGPVVQLTSVHPQRTSLQRSGGPNGPQPVPCVIER